MGLFTAFSTLLVLSTLINQISARTTTILNDNQLDDSTATGPISILLDSTAIASNETIIEMLDITSTISPEYNSTEIDIENVISPMLNQTVEENGDVNKTQISESFEAVEPIIQIQASVNITTETVGSAESLNKNATTDAADPTDDMPDVEEEKSPKQPSEQPETDASTNSDEFVNQFDETIVLDQDESGEVNRVDKNSVEVTDDELNEAEIDSVGSAEKFSKANGDKNSSNENPEKLSLISLYALIGGLVIVAIIVLCSVYRYAKHQQAMKKLIQDPLTIEQASRLV